MVYSQSIEMFIVRAKFQSAKSTECEQNALAVTVLFLDFYFFEPFFFIIKPSTNLHFCNND